MATHPVKTGDTVLVIAGKDRGKTGKVLQVFPRLVRVSVQGINVMKRHMRSRRAGDKGQIVQFPMPIHLSNVRVTNAAESASTEETSKKEVAPKAKTTRKAKT
jgi:large subunit ribosomal protein L24